MWNLIPHNLIVHGDENQPLKVGLSHQKPVKGIAMYWWKSSSPLGVFNGDRERPEAMGLDGSSHLPPKDQLSRRPLNCNLPDRYSADKNFIPRRGNCGTMRLRQFGIVRVPPKK